MIAYSNIASYYILPFKKNIMYIYIKFICVSCAYSVCTIYHAYVCVYMYVRKDSAAPAHARAYLI